jgi:L-lysine exporter family protein LysE/ArgO
MILAHFIIIGFLAGFGLAMGVGPVTLLIIRTNLADGFWSGITIGLGAVCADFTYLILLCTGSLFILNQPTILKIVGIVGAIILLYFGIKTMRSPIVINKENTITVQQHRHFVKGFLVCITSPFGILFWAGMASTVATISAQVNGAIYGFALGLFLGVVSWLIILNGSLRIMHHQISPRALHVLNQIGGLMIIGFGIYGLVKVFI